MKIKFLVISFIAAFMFFGMQTSKNTIIKNGKYVVKFRLFKTIADTVSISDIEISRPITLAQYKVFLNTIDHSEREQFKPDYRIIKRNYNSVSSYNTISWETYFNSGEFDNYPVLGVTWESAVKYCEWLNQKESLRPTQEKEYEYRLPTPKELVVHFQYFAKKQILTHNYEWTINVYDEAPVSRMEKRQYNAKNDDPLSMKRKTIICTSTSKDKINYVHYDYQNQSNEHTSFRVVKEYKK